MSDYSISIVPRLSTYSDHKVQAAKVLTWLAGLNIIAPTPTNCILSQNLGYEVAAGAVTVVQEPQHLPFNLLTNGLELTTERRIFDNGGNGIDEIICPACLLDISTYDWDFLDSWTEGTDAITCPRCDVASDIHLYRFTPAWGFSNLGFTFWNWPNFTEEFLAAFRIKLGCDVDVVFQRL